jgi:glycogen debranching enzyme
MPFVEHGLWDEEDGFYYDQLHLPDDSHIPMKIRSFVGLIPLYAVETIEPNTLDHPNLRRFRKPMLWFIKYRPNLIKNVASLTTPGQKGRYLLSLISKEKLERVMERMVDEGQFLSDYGLRSLSKEHEAHPYTFHVNGHTHSVQYLPAESNTGLFGGNSNWRGPIWLPLNYLMIESLQKFHHYYGNTLKVELPRGSGNHANLDEAATELSQRLTNIFLRDEDGRRPFYGGVEYFQKDPHWRD